MYVYFSCFMVALVFCCSNLHPLWLNYSKHGDLFSHEMKFRETNISKQILKFRTLKVQEGSSCDVMCHVNMLKLSTAMLYSMYHPNLYYFMPLQGVVNNSKSVGVHSEMTAPYFHKQLLWHHQNMLPFGLWELCKWMAGAQKYEKTPDRGRT